MKYSFGFIGCGNMGGTLAAAVAKTVGGAAVAVYDRDESKSNALRETYGVSVLDGTALVKACKFVVLGVKPQVMENALAELKNARAENENVTLITMAAGLSISAIRAMAGGEYPVIRIMPNTPCALGKGVVLYATDGVSQCDEQRQHRKQRTFFPVFRARAKTVAGITHAADDGKRHHRQQGQRCDNRTQHRPKINTSAV